MTGLIEGFLGVLNVRFRDFFFFLFGGGGGGGGVGKFSKYLFGWFDLRGDFFEYSKQSEES